MLGVFLLLVPIYKSQLLVGKRGQLLESEPLTHQLLLFLYDGQSVVTAL